MGMTKARRISGLNLYGVFSAGQGYSGMTEQFGIALNRQVPVSVIRFHDTPAINISKQGWDLLKIPYQHHDVAVTIGFPAAFDSMRAHKFRVGYTMFETDQLPNGEPWAGKGGDAAATINRTCDLLLVPCQHNVEVFKAAGVTVPIEVVHNGLHPTGFPVMDRSKRPEGHKYTFLIMGTLSLRKNSGAVISAFIQQFRNIKDVRLIVKTQSGTHGHMEFAKELGDIEIIDAVYTEKQLRKLMKEADCFVFPSHGEGFGLPPLEAAATGMPTIVARNTGMNEYADYMFAIDSEKTAPALRYPKSWGEVGNWYEPDFQQLMDAMWYCYAYQDEARDIALEAAPLIRRDFDYRKVSQDMLDAIEKHLPVIE